MRIIISNIFIFSSAFIISVSQVGADREHTQELLDHITHCITLIVPWSAGGRSDYISRVLATELEPIIGKKICVINQPGGKGTHGWSNAASARPDGTVLTIYNKGLPKNRDDGPSLQDFQPIALVAKDYGFLAPKNTPEDIINVFESAIGEALRRGKLKKAILKIGSEPHFVGHSDFLAEIKK